MFSKALPIKELADSCRFLTVISILWAGIRRLASCGTLWLADCCAPKVPVCRRVKEDNLVDMAIKRILVNLALLVWVLCGQTLAQRSEPQPLGAESKSVEPVQPETRDQLNPDDSRYQSLEEESSVGQCCELCGGGAYCPPDWYVDQGVRIWHRCRPRQVPLAGDFTSTYFISEIEGQDLWKVSGTEIPGGRLTTKSFGFDVATGYDITLGHYLGRDTKNRDHFVEFTYFGMNDWEVSLGLIGDTQPAYQGETWNQAEYDQYIAGTRIPIVSGYVGSLISSYPAVTIGAFGYTFADGSVATPDDAVISRAFNNVQNCSVTYRSTIDNFELNMRIRPRGRNDRLVLHSNGRWRRECQQGWFMSYLFGMRVLTLDEGFWLYTSGSRYGAELWIGPSGPEYIPTADPTYTKSGSLVISTHNRLVGLQFGGDLIRRHCLWEWGFRYKVGAMMNFADQTSRLVARQTDPSLPAVTLTRHATVDGASALADLGVVGSYKILPNVTFHAAWDWMWIAGLALAPEQIVHQRDTGPRVNDNGWLFFQGLTLNLECNW